MIRAEIDRAFAHLETVGIPELKRKCPDEADFWPELAGILEDLEDRAGAEAAYVGERIDALLAATGLNSH